MKAQADLCRSLRFAASLAGYALEGHVIKNISISAGMHDVCRDRCTMEGTCVSFNIGPKINDKVLCQLSDSDHTMYPDDLKLRAGFTYRGTEVRCGYFLCNHIQEPPPPAPSSSSSSSSSLLPSLSPSL